MSEKFTEILNTAYDYEEALKRQNLSHDDVVELRRRATSLPTVPKLLFDKQLILFTNLTKGNLNDAAKWLEHFYRIKQTAPEFFSNRNPDSEELKFSYTIQEMSPLPISPDNHFVFVHRTQNYQPSNYIFDDVVKMFFMMCEIEIFKHGPRNGVIFLSDWTGVKFGHMFVASVSSIRKSLDFVQHASPIPVRAVHILNSSSLVQMAFSMAKPFMSKQLFDMVHVHPSGMNFNTEFFKKYLPKENMPSDYGGDLPSISELHKKNCENLHRFKEYFELEEKQMKHQLDNENTNDHDDRQTKYSLRN